MLLLGSQASLSSIVPIEYSQEFQLNVLHSTQRYKNIFFLRINILCRRNSKNGTKLINEMYSFYNFLVLKQHITEVKFMAVVTAPALGYNL